MVFSSIEFLIFFAIVFVTLLVVESKPVIEKVAEPHIRRFRHIFLLVACSTVADLMSTDKMFKQYVTDIEKMLVPAR